MGSDRPLTPVAIRVDKSRLVWVEWADGRVSRFPLDYLRRQCPCTTCCDIREKQQAGGLRVLEASGVPTVIEIDRVEPVGRYALKFIWNDRHDSGIYSFDLLREMCPDRQSMEDVAQRGRELERESRRLNPSLWHGP